MKTKYQIAFAAVAFGLMGCDGTKQAEVNRPEAARNTNVTAQDVRKKVGEAVDATKSYAAENKDRFVASMEPKMKDLNQKIDELGKKTEALAADAKEQANKTVDSLREQRGQLGQKFDELKKSSQDAWKDVKAGFESAMKELEKAYDEAKAKLGS